MASLLRSRSIQVLCAVLAAFVLFACHLGQEEKTENKLTFSKHYETLSGFDRVEIAVVNLETGDTTVIFRGKVDNKAEISSLEVPGWEGGAIQILISGFQTGVDQPIYVETKKYDGKTRATDSIAVLITNTAGLSAVGGQFLQIQEGSEFPLPALTLKPANLRDTAILWSSDKPDVAAVRNGRLVGVSPGSATLTARLHYDTSRAVTFSVTVQSDATAPQSLALKPDTLFLAQNGAAAAFEITANPATASTQVTWTLSDSSLVLLGTDGSFRGRKVGVTQAIATSKVRAQVKATGYIKVSEPVRVESVRFKADTATAFVGGTPLLLDVEVLPEKANRAVTYALSDSTKARLDGATLVALASGSMKVFVVSQEDASKADTLEVQVRQAVRVQSVVASRDTLTLFVKGPAATLTAKVLPDSAPQGIQWTSLTPSVATVGLATGRVEPLTPGAALMVASSQGDSTKKDTVQVSVKLDRPKLTVGKDTTLSAGETLSFVPVVTQEYGSVVMFKWDLDGDQVWDDSAAALREVSRAYAQAKVYGARLFVRDTEGNEVIVTRQVTVVSSAAVSIEEPKDNSYTNKKTIPVIWYVNAVKQTTQDSATLVDGANVITRTAKDGAGKDFTAKVTVYLDTAAPGRPTLSGTSPTNVKPVWSWTSGGGGNREFRIRLGDGNFPANAPITRDSSFTLQTTPVSGTTYTLFVQERDLAGNWSPSGSLPILYDETKPVVLITGPKASGTYYTATSPVTVTGTVGGPLPITQVSYKVGTGGSTNAVLANGAWTTSGITLQEGVPAVVTITALDNAGNTGEATLTLFLDKTIPNPPTIATGPAAQIQELKGTFSWNPGSDVTGGSGLNGRYRYNVNGGAWKDTSAVLLTDLPLQEGNNQFNVQEQDQALNWSNSATRLVKVDVTGPTLSVTSHTSPVSHASMSITLSGTVRDSGTGVASLFVNGQASGATAVTVTGTSWTTASLGLQTGANTLVLTATDGVGNVRTVNVVVNVNVPAPVVVITSPANNSTLTRLDTAIVRYTIDGTPGSQSFNLTEGSNSLVVSSPPNASGNIGRDTVIVVRDATAPNSPNLAAGTTPTKGTATWTWTSRGDNSGGAGMRTPAQYQYQLDNGAWTATNAARLDLDNLTEGSHTLVVQEQDRAGNWSVNSTARTIVIDRTGPVVTITSPSEGWITNQSTVFITWTEKDGAAAPVSKSGTFNLPTDQALNTVEVVSAADAANNTGSATVGIWRRSNVVFVKSGATGGDGNSWSTPLGTLQAALAIANSTTKKQIWMRAGTYKPTTSRGFELTSDVAIYGGFGDVGTPNSIAQRDSSLPYRTILSGRSQTDTLIYASSPDFNNNPMRGVILNSLRIEGHANLSYQGIILVNLMDFLIANCEFTKFWHNFDPETGETTGSANLIWGNGRIVNCTFRFNSGNRQVVDLMGYNDQPGNYGIMIDKSVFSDNGALNPVVFMLNGELTFTGTQFLDYVGEGHQIRTNAPFPTAVLTFKSCTVRGGINAISHGGTLNYDSSNKEP